MFDLGNIGTRLKADTELRCVAVAPVVLQQASTHITGGHSNDRILAGIVGRRTVKELYANSPLLQPIEAPVENSFYNKPEELLTAVAPLERRTLDQIVEMPSQGFNFRVAPLEVRNWNRPDRNVRAR
ncbi:MAG: hypothetical protein WB622_21235 [Acidobacteriaceae bacterium]